MAKEIIDLCSENVVFSDNVQINSNGLKYALENAGMPFNVGSKYILVPQLNHAQPLRQDPEKSSKRFVIAEIRDNAVKNIRTVSISGLTQRVLGFVDREKDAPVIKTKLNDKGLNRPDGATWTPCVSERLPLGLTEDNRAVVHSAASIVAEGSKECYIPQFEDKGANNWDMVSENGSLILGKNRFNFWKVVPTVEAEVKMALEAIKNSRFASYLQ